LALAPSDEAAAFEDLPFAADFEDCNFEPDFEDREPESAPEAFDFGGVFLESASTLDSAFFDPAFFGSTFLSVVFEPFEEVRFFTVGIVDSPGLSPTPSRFRGLRAPRCSPRSDRAFAIAFRISAGDSPTSSFP
jgi:hypothetical protein